MRELAAEQERLREAEERDAQAAQVRGRLRRYPIIEIA